MSHVNIGIRKIAPQKIAPYENTPLWIFSPMKITPHIFAPWENYPHWNPLPTCKSYEWKKKQSYLFFCLEESCGIRHPYQNNQGLPWYTYDLTENTGLDTFFTEWKKSKNWTKAKFAKWHLRDSCTSQGELKLGNQIIKFGTYMKLLNSQLSIDSTLWVFKKANS